MASRVRKGDQVIVIAGKDKGKKGEVLRVIPQEDRVLVQGVNIIVRHTKQSMSNQGGLVRKESPLHISNVALIDPTSSKPTRVGYKFIDGDRKVRIARRSGEQIDR